MKWKWLYLAIFCLMVLSVSQANASYMYAQLATDPDPTVPVDSVEIGSQFYINIFIENDFGMMLGGSMPLVFFDSSGSIVNISHVDIGGESPLGYSDNSILGLNGWDGDGLWGMLNQWTGFSWDNVLPDTVNWTGATLGGWMPEGAPVNYLRFGLQTDEAGMICIDSVDHPNAIYDWLFDDPNVTFGGPYCWKVYDTLPPENQPPVLDPIGNKEVNENENLNFTVTASDPDGTTPTITATGLPTGATFIANVFDWTPTYDQAGDYPVTFTASDGDLEDSETITITVHNVNRAPVLDPVGNKEVNENENLNFTVTASDPDGTTPTITATGLPTGATFIGNVFDWTPTYDQAGDYPVTFTASDGDLEDSETITITVHNVNRAPVLDPVGNKEVNENENLNFAVTASDPDGTTPTITATGLPTGATFIGNVFDWTPTYDQAGDYPVTFTASDGDLEDSETITITVHNVNRAPVLDPVGNKEVNENENLNFTVTASDPDGTTPTITATGLPTGATFIGNVFDWTPTYDQAGDYPVTFTASDGDLEDSETITITVHNVNRAPVLDPVGNKEVNENENLNFTVTASDPDGTTPTITATGLPTGATFIGNVFDWTPTYDQAGDYPVTFTASDGDLEDSETITITVHNVNRAPILDQIATGPVSVDEGASLVLDITASDPDGTIPSIDYSGTLPDNASFTNFGDGTAQFVFNPDYDQAGDYFITFFASDGDLTDDETVMIIVNDVPVGVQLMVDPDFIQATHGQQDGIYLGSITVTELDAQEIPFWTHVQYGWLYLDTISVSPLVTPETIDVYLMAAALDTGLHTDSIFIYWDVGGLDSLMIPVQMFIVDQYVLTADPGFFEFDIYVGESVTDTTLVYETLMARNVAFQYSYDAPWLSVTNEDSLITPEKLHITATDIGLTLDSLYFDSIFIYPDYAEVPEELWFDTVGIHVSLTVTEFVPVLTATPDNFAFTLNPDQIESAVMDVAEQTGESVEFAVDVMLASSWLTIDSIPDVITPGSVFFTVNSSGMTPGSYFDTLVIFDPLDAAYENVLVPVVLTVEEEMPITIDFNPTMIAVSVLPGANASESTFVREEYGRNIGFTVVTHEPWVEVVFGEVAYWFTPEPIWFWFESFGLAPGVYVDTAEFIFDYNDDTLIHYFPLQLTVEEPLPYELVVDPTSFDVTLMPGEVGYDSVYVTELHGRVVGFAAETHESWLVIADSLPDEYTPAMVHLYFDARELLPGIYMDSIVFSSIDFAPLFDPVAVPVVLTVEGPPPDYVVQTEPIGFNWTVTQGYGIADSLHVFEQFGRSVPFMFYNTQPWLVVDPFAMPPVDYVTPYTLPVAANSDGLVPGMYIDTIFILPDTDIILFPPVAVPVVFNVEGPGPETQDSVWISTVPGIPGNDVVVPVYFRNFEFLAAINLPLTWSSDAITLNEVTFDGTEVEYVDNKPVTIDNASRRVQIGVIPTFTPSVDPSRGMLAKLHFTVSDAVTEAVVTVDTTTIPPSGGLMFIDETLSIIVPTFIPGSVVIDTTAGFVCGRVIDIYGNEIEGATVELWDDFPGGGMMISELTDMNGQFACHTTGVSPFDAYAYKEGYYPGLVEEIAFGEIGIEIVLTPVPPVTPTPEWVDFYCDLNYFFNVPLPVGSVVDAYDPDGIHCGTYFVTQAGEYGFMPVYRDDIFTIEDEGADPGDTISFFINGYPANAVGDRIWTENGDNFEVCLDVFTVEERTVELADGWNLISWNVDTPVDDLLELLAPIMECVEVVLGFENGGLTFDPALPEFSTLWSMDHFSAYWVKMNCDDSLVVEGVPLAETTPIPLNAGWNLVSYLPHVTYETPVALASILDEFLIVALGFDSVAQTYDPLLPEYSTLNTMSPGFGYWLKVYGSCDLIYPGVGPSVSFRQTFAAAAARRAMPEPIVTSRIWMNIYAHELILDGYSVPAGSQISAVAADGRVVGSGIVNADGRFGFVPVYADDPATSEIEGLTAGEEFILVVDGIETEESFGFTEPGGRVEISSLTSRVSGDLLPNDFALGQNYPNPFNPFTSILFSVPSTMPATVEVYNILGKKIITLFDGIAEAGTNTIEWDGLDQYGHPVSTGVYFYRMSAGDFESTRKMVLMK